MKSRYAPLLGLLLGALAITSSHAADTVATEGAEVGKWTMDFDAAVKLAGEKKMPMMLNFTGSDWCGWCKLMDKEIFAEEEWKKYAAEHVVLVTLDFPRDETIVPEKYKDRNRELQAKYSVRGFPTYVILDSDGETAIGQLGAGRDKTPSSFIEEFKQASRMSAANIEAYAKANPDKADAYKAAIAEFRKAQKELKDWVMTGPEQNEENNKIFEGFKKRIEEANAKLEKF